ncbi:hypothetical protein [Vallicoccus soli]|uniref:hypothetical protein n=1 Tax=Vallicoccus soli TaxID=2339232 RepID=UPI0010592E2A|nr:hypothetical protein [Vallicoccus soli]
MAQDEGDDGRMWRRSWFPLLRLHGAEVLAVDCVDPGGRVWIVRWEADEIGPVAPDLATLLNRSTDRMRAYDVTTSDGGFALELPPDDPPSGWY